MITIEKYAELCALMSDTGGDESKEFAIAEEHGVNPDEWKASKAGFTAKMSDPSDMGKTAMAFMPLYQAALENKSGGVEPCTLEVYTKVHAEMAYLKDPDDVEKKIDYMIVLGEHGFSHQSWLECENYWTPRVGSDENPKYDAELGTKFRVLMQEESDRIFGITR
jgi:hypothetical protein